MIIGSIIVALCLFVLGWTKEIVGVFIEDKPTAKTCTIALAVISIYAVDFAINAGKLHDFLLYGLPLLRLTFDGSTIVFAKSDRRHASHTQAATRFSLG